MCFTAAIGLFMLFNFGKDLVSNDSLWPIEISYYAAEPGIGLFISFYFVFKPSAEEFLLQWIVEIFLQNELMQRNHNSVQLKHLTTGIIISEQ